MRELPARWQARRHLRLMGLMDKSLVRRDDSGRYNLHRLLQQFAAEKLDAFPERKKAAIVAHCEYFAEFLHAWEPDLRGAGQAQALVAIAAEIDNLRAAWKQAVAQRNAQVIGRSLTSLGMFYTIRGWHQEGAEILEQARAMLEGDGREVTQAAVLAWLGSFLHQLGEYERAQRALEKSLEILRPSSARLETAFALYTLAALSYHASSEYGRARELFLEGLTLYRELGDPYGEAHCLDGLGDVAARQGQLDEARQFYEQGLALRRQLGDQWGISASLGSLGGLAGRQGAYDEAQRWFEESLALGRQLDNPRGIAACLHNLSTLAYIREEYAEAKQLRMETLAICQQIGYRWGIASALKSLGDVAGRMGEFGEARRLLQESLDILAEAGDRRSQGFTLNSLGTVTLALGLDREALGYYRRALAAALEIQEPALALDVLMSVAQIWCNAGDWERALELLAFLLDHPALEHQTRSKAALLSAELAGQLTQDAADAAQMRGRNLDLDAVASIVMARPLDIGPPRLG